VFDAPVIFVLENNGWAISLPTSRQTRAPELVARAVGYGIAGARVDGNDVSAVRAVVAEATDRARSGGGPTLVEAVTFRMGGHTTSDDPTRYRNDEDVVAWRARDPLLLFRESLGRSPATEARLAEIEQQVNVELDRAVDDWFAERGLS